MDDQNRPAPADNNPPGAPELSGSPTPSVLPSAPLVEERHTGPIFKAEPTPAAQQAQQAVPIGTPPEPFVDDDDDGESHEPPALDEHQARIEYLQSLRKDKPAKKKRGSIGKILLVVFLILVIVGAVGASVYFFFHSSRPAKKTSVKATTQQQATQQTPTQQTTEEQQPTTDKAKKYSSTKFGLSLEYPSDWAPEETTDKLTVTSPVVTLTDASGQSATGRIVMAVRPKQAKPAEFAGGKVVAVLASEKVNYTKPAVTQAGTTYLSYLQYSSTNVKGGMDGIYITGDYGYQYAQEVPVADVSTLSPLIDVTFVSCADTACAVTAQKPLTLSSTTWKTDSTNRPVVEKILKSITLN